MLTRLIDCDSNLIRVSCRKDLRRSLLTKSLFAGITACCAIGFATEASADNELQLQAPLNSTLTIRAPQTNWQRRDEPSDQADATETTASAPSMESVSEDLSKAPIGPTATETASASKAPARKETTSAKARLSGARISGKSIDAKPASGPLDRFRKPSRQAELGIPLPSDRAARPETKSAGLPPRLPATKSNAWQNRTASQPLTSSQPSGVSAKGETRSPADAFRPPIGESRWIARDAVNRIEPLRDPVAKRVAQPVAKPAEKPVIEPAAPAPKPIAAESDWSSRGSSKPSAADAPNKAPRPTPRSPLKNLHGTSDLEELPNAEAQNAEAQPAAEAPATADVPPRAPAPKKIAAKSSEEVAKESLPATRSVELESPRQEASPEEPAEPSQWTDEVLESLLEPAPLSGSLSAPANSRIDERSVERDEAKRDDAKPQSLNGEIELGTPLTETSTKPSAELNGPKEKVTPFQPRNEADLSSSAPDRRANRSAPKKLVPPTAATPIASGSAGDLAQQDSAPAPLDYTGRPASEIRPNRSVASLRRGIEQTLRYFYDRPEVATGRSNWGMMHSMMVFGTDTNVIVGRQKFNAIAWIAGNNNCRGQRLLTNDATGVMAKSGAGLQGHQGQFLAVLGMCNVPLDYPLYAGGTKYSVQDLLEAEKRACRTGEELTFTLIGLSHYIDTDSSWIADDGTRWDFERLLAEELKQPIVGAACGGTHRLMGYSHALRKRRAEGRPLEGQWRRAELYTEDFIDYAYSLQNRDGSMSTKWFEGRADNGDVDRKIQTTGHMVEWLLTLTPDDQLQDPKLVRAVNFLMRRVGSDLKHDWSIGPKGHALRSMAMYHQRVFQAGAPWVRKGRQSVATGTANRRR